MITACDAVQSGAIKQLWKHANRFQRSILKKGYAKDPTVVAKEAFLKASYKSLDVILVNKAGCRHEYEPLTDAFSRYEYFL